jgi:GntR family transcriptional regulator
MGRPQFFTRDGPMKTDFIYLKLYNELKGKIDSGELKPGDKLPPEYKLQEHYKVSRDTIRKSLTKLEQNGYIKRKAATGTFVTRQKADYTLSKVKSFSEQMYDRGAEPSSDILSIELLDSGELPPEVCERLEIRENSKVYKICRIRKANNDPMAFETVFIPYDLCPDIQTRLDAKASLYAIYEKNYGHQITSVQIVLDAEMPSAQVKKRLDLDSATPILKMLGTAFLDGSVPLYYVICYYAADKYTFSTQLPR